MSQKPERSEELRTKVFGERAVYNDMWVRVTLVDIETPDGRRFEHHVVRLKTVALAAVLDDQDRVLMLWRHRFVTDEWGWELPGGIARRRRGRRRGGSPGGAGGDGVAARAAGAPVHVPADAWDGGHASCAFRGTQGGEGRRAERRRGGSVVDWVPMSWVRELIDRGEVLGSGSLVACSICWPGGRGERQATRTRASRRRCRTEPSRAIAPVAFSAWIRASS